MALIYDEVNKNCRSELGDSDGLAIASLVLGGLEGAKFIPNINASKWHDQAWLNINHTDSIITTVSERLTGDQISITVGDLVHRYYIDKNGDLEYEIILDKLPKQNTISLDLAFADGLSFHYQPALTQDQIDLGFYRPDNVIGSYAVYWKERNNHFKTGKFCHIYRPKAIDAKGVEIWLEQQIDEKSKTWTITIPQEWLDAAAYPVIIDPTLGYSTNPASAYGTDYAFALKGTSDASGGTTSELHAYLSNTYVGTAHAKMVVYGDDSGNSCPEAKVGSDITITLAASASKADCSGAYVQTLSANTPYWVALLPEADPVQFYYDSVSGRASLGSGYTWASGLPATWGHTNTPYSDIAVGFWVVYTAAPSFPFPPLFAHRQNTLLRR